ncbi:helix-turn-helix domain-containing protein [Gemmatimonadota bacterium]
MGARRYIDLKGVRAELGWSQAEFADMLGVSARTVQSCEQGWRNPSAAVEKAVILLLMGKRLGPELGAFHCWDTLECSEEERAACVVHQTRQGHLCWLLTGNVCQGEHLHSWEDKMETCLHCAFFQKLLPEGVPTR